VVTDSIISQPGEPGEPDDTVETEWCPLGQWPSDIAAVRRTIEECDEVIPLLENASDDFAVHTALDFVRTVRGEAKAALAMGLLAMHRIELPERGDWKTPQEMIQANLRKVAEDAKARQDIRPEDVGMKQPPASRARLRSSLGSNGGDGDGRDHGQPRHGHGVPGMPPSGPSR
jgi:hypothetical protein